MSEKDRGQLRQELVDAQQADAQEAQKVIADELSKISGRVAEEVNAQIAKIEADHQLKFDYLQQGIILAAAQLTTTEMLANAARMNHNEVLKGAQALIEMGLNAEADDVIAKGLGSAQEALSHGARPSVAEAADLNELLIRIPEKFSTDRDIVNASLRDARSNMGVQEQLWEQD